MATENEYDREQRLRREGKKRLPIIGLYSNHSGCGKSTIAKYLTQTHRFEHIKLSCPFKDMLHVLYHHMGIPDADILSMMEGSLKDTTIAELGKNPREMMISLGQEWGRGLVHPDIWVTVAEMRMSRKASGAKGFIIDDVRQPNEWDMLDRIGAIKVRVDRDTNLGTFAVDGLLSEKEPDAVILNDGDKRALYRAIDRVLIGEKP